MIIRLDAMKKVIISLLMAAFLVAPLAPVFVEAKVVASAVKPVMKIKNTKAKPVVKKSPAKATVKSNKITVKKEASPVVITAASADEIGNVSVSSVSSSATTNPTASCMGAIKNANKFCKKIARGCSSQNKTEKCVAANEQCEAQQQEALALCPATN